MTREGTLTPIYSRDMQIIGNKEDLNNCIASMVSGMIKHYNRALEEYLQKAVSLSQQDWDVKVLMFLLAYQSAIHWSTEWSPAEMLYGRELCLSSDLLFGVPPDKKRSA